MANLRTKYLGLNLKNPIIVGSCGLTNSVANLIEIEKKGAGAVVLKSIFEEQIMHEVSRTVASQNEAFYYPEAEDYISEYTKQHKLQEYLDLIKEAKKAISIPIIASINCTSVGKWTKFAQEIEQAGADALELNIFVLPTDPEKTSSEYENNYFNILEDVKEIVNIPVAIKTSLYFSSLAKTMVKLSWAGVDGLVLFNRYYSPDIDIDKMTMTSTNVFSKHEENALVLRWVALLSNKLKSDLCATTGIHSGFDVIKQLLAGASAIQIVSAIYKKGFDIIPEMLQEIERWMDSKNFESIADFKGKMSFEKTENPDAYLRIQFMKYFAGIE
ncbi:MAG: dihydroorotate dehydrogenase-like protein [Bacteroidales bacterium]|nr:dihydroorotate dehydrogenase-like protein [Bacteroidales bacterium]MDY0215602.1 dihydroorotate dehydrogenase-like protein [Bacteroidales bacterium]